MIVGRIEVVSVEVVEEEEEVEAAVAIEAAEEEADRVEWATLSPN